MPETYDKLEVAIRSRTTGGRDKRDPLIVLYFDEIHSLTRERELTVRPNTQGDAPGSTQAGPTSSGDIHPTPYAAMHSAITGLDGRSCFTLFISTCTPAYAFDPSWGIPRSGVPVDHGAIQAPSTETPFDCHPSFPVMPSDYTLAETAEIGFLVRFGRPLSVSSRLRSSFSC